MQNVTMRTKKTIECSIERVYMFLNPEHSKVFVRVSWDGRPAKDELRTCWEKDGQLMLGKGIALSMDEIADLHNFIMDGGMAEEDDEPDGVDFSAIFESSKGIMDKRRDGYRTDNGFIVLTRKDGKTNR